MSDPDRRHAIDGDGLDRSTDRRSLLVSTGLTAMAAVSASVAGASSGFVERLLRTRFAELSPERKTEILADLEREYSERYGPEVTVADTPPMDGVEFGYGLDLARCVGCRRCVYACVHENNQSRDPQIHWIRVLRMEKEKGIELTESTAYYEPELVPEPDAFYLPVACQQCRNPPCVKVCPVKATWQEPDGIVVIDYDWCIGCRCCMSACPYGARHFNWAEPRSLPRSSTRTPTTSATDRGRRGWWRSAPSASTGRARGATRPASRSARWGRASSATCSTRPPRCAT